jgi:cytochrome d ubiquinol oxidase subunit I
VDPIAAMANPAALSQTVHMTIAAYAATGLAVAGIHALVLLRRKEMLTPAFAHFHRRALAIALGIGAPAALLQPFSGDLSARFVARYQPVKLAALEGHFETTRGAPLNIGGWPDEKEERTRFALQIPHGLSLLAFHDPGAEVRGLKAFPREDWPPVVPVHLAFQLMVGLGTTMALVSLWAIIASLRKHRWEFARDVSAERGLLRAIAVVAPFGFLATEAGWMVTEIGRQPWIVYGVLRTQDAVTPMPGLIVPFLFFTLLYCALGATVVWLLWRQIVKTSEIAVGAVS